MSDTAEGPDKMTTVALDRVVQGKLDIGYGPGSSDEQADKNEGSAGR